MRSLNRISIKWFRWWYVSGKWSDRKSLRW